MSTFLLELGTEELPADFTRIALSELKEHIASDMSSCRLDHGKIYCTSTPRRIVVSIEELALSASDLIEERKGPPALQAFKDGKPTQAAIGFSKSAKVDLDSLEIRETPKGPFVFAKVVEKGLSASELLSQLLPKWIFSIQGRRFMRWGSGAARFSRPIRWIVSLLDEEIISFSLEGSDPVVTSGRQSRGHRLHSQSFEIPSAGEYIKLILDKGVQVDREKRRELIKDMVSRISLDLDAKPDLPNNLLEELTDLLEAPLLINGTIEEKYLDLPSEVLSTVMKVHQRYIPLYLSNSSIDPLSLDARKNLIASFLCIVNSLPDSLETVRKGNERVLKARLADAKFFFDADLALPSLKRLDKLRNVTFAEGLGSLYDRVERMQWISDELIKQINPNDSHFVLSVRRATKLCKHDLVSNMVGEFPELQGLMGGKYLIAEGEPREVALAVLEHYQPRGAGDDMPASESGALLAITDRLELLLSIFVKGERPSGSSDPYALRRAGNGILQILWSKKWKLDLFKLISLSCDHWSNLFPDFKIGAKTLKDDLCYFIRQRIITLLEESAVDQDIVQSVAGETIPIKDILSDPLDAKLRAELLSKMRASGELQNVQAVVTRAARLASQGELSLDIISTNQVVDPNLFESRSESQMLKVLETLEPIIREESNDRYEKLARGLAAGADALSEFFDGKESVMVMVESSEIRTNRLNLLSILRNQASVIADFSCIK